MGLVQDTERRPVQSLVNKRRVKGDEVGFRGQLLEPPCLEDGNPNEPIILKSGSKSPSPLDVTQLIISQESPKLVFSLW